MLALCAHWLATGGSCATHAPVTRASHIFTSCEPPWLCWEETSVLVPGLADSVVEEVLDFQLRQLGDLGREAVKQVIRHAIVAQHLPDGL